MKTRGQGSEVRGQGIRHNAVRDLEEARIRREIARLEAAYDEATEAGLRIARLAAARALRWAVDGGTAPSGEPEVSRQRSEVSHAA